MLELSIESGVYILEIHLPEVTSLQIGKLGNYELYPGYYYYTGTAQGNLSSRLVRHLSDEKTMRWHIDYLLEYGEVIQVYIWPGEREMECQLGSYLLRFPAMQIPVSGFGASDCKCNSHLYYTMCRPNLDNLLHMVKEDLGIKGQKIFNK